MDEVNIGSFPRSGNHFLVKILRILLPELKVNWIEHNIHWLGIKPNVITIVRNPIDCISSWINFTQDIRENRADKILEWYCEYQNKCISLKETIYIVDFTKLISDTESIIDSICSFYKIQKNPNFNLLPSFDAQFCNSVPFQYDRLSLSNEISNSKYFEIAIDLYNKALKCA
jgi:hypothetical protein